MAKTPIIATVDDLIDALGGTNAVAAWASVDKSAVSHWRRLRRIPGRWHYLLQLECKARRLDVDFDAIFADAGRSGPLELSAA